MRRAADPRAQRYRAFIVLAVTLSVLAGAGSTAAGPARTSAPLAVLADTEPPSVPQGMAFAGKTRTTVSLVWRAASDNVGVRGYRLFKNGRAVATVTNLRHTYRGLRCGTRYTFALEAYDAAGNASYRPEAVGSISTRPCGTTAPPATPKRKTPPAQPVSRPRSGSANVWVDPTGGACTRLSPAGAYVDALACGNLTSAYNAAAAGDTIVVTAGTYGRQVVPNGVKQLTIRNAAGSRPTLGTTTVRASNISLIGVSIVRNDDPGSEATLAAMGANNRYVGVHVDSKNAPARQGIFVHGDGNLFRGGSSFNVVDEKGAHVTGSDVTFDRMSFHDVKVTHSSVHNECIYSLGPSLTVRNSRFWNCATMDLFITRGSWYNQPVYGNVTIENNVFGASRMPGGAPHYYSLGINGSVIQEMRNWRVVNNTFEIPASGEGTPAPGTIWANNLGDWDNYPGALYSGNVGNKIGATDKAASMARIRAGWVDSRMPPATDFHLKARSPAVNAADPKYAPARDQQGKPRNGAPDAGAYEYSP